MHAQAHISTSAAVLIALAFACLSACDREHDENHNNVREAGPQRAAITADSVYHNARIYTVDANRSWADAVAIKDGNFIAVGRYQDMQELVGSGTESFDLGGAMMLPGLYDLHVHPMDGGRQALYECSFPITLPISEILQSVAVCAADTPAGEWIRGGQWGTELLYADTTPHRARLDAVTPDNPVFLVDSAFHSAWLNSKALRVLNIDATTQDPEGGVIVRDPVSGEPTGILFDNAAYAVIQAMPGHSPEEYQEALRWSVRQLNRYGVTAIKDALADNDTVAAYAALDNAGGLHARVATSLPWKSVWTETSEQQLDNIERRQRHKTARVATDFIKIMLDGIPPSYTAVFLDPYLPDAQHGADFRGQLMVPAAELRRGVIDFDARGLTVKIHTAGDGALRAALDAFQAARETNGDSGLRHEVSHASYIHPDDIPRFQALNVTAELSPIFWYRSPIIDAMANVLGAERAYNMFPIRSLLTSGARMVYGSDWPVVAEPNPWPGVEAMITRSDPSGRQNTTLWPEQAIDLASAIEILTRNGAAAMYLEQVSGSIEVGKSADMIVLDRNLFEIPAEQIGETQVLRTVLEGRVVYSAEAE